jgi:hypothetical protein
LAAEVDLTGKAIVPKASDRRNFEMTTPRERFEKHVVDLVRQVQIWLKDDDEWTTRAYPKRFRDVDQQIFEIPSLFIQKGPTRMLLDPIAYDVPGAEAAVDLYLMPTYDDLATLYFEKGGWSIHYPLPADDANGIQGEGRALPLSPQTFRDVLNLIAAHAVSSI